MSLATHSRNARIINSLGDEHRVRIHVIGRRSTWRSIKALVLREPCPYLKARQSAHYKHLRELSHAL